MQNNEIVIREKDNLPARDPLLNNYLDSFLNSQDVKQSSKDTYRKSLKQFIKWISGEGITSPTRETVLSYKTYLETLKLSPLSISTYLVAVRKFFEWTEGLKYYPNVAKGIKGAKFSKVFKKNTLTVKQIKELLEHIERFTFQGKRDYALLNLLIRTGLRTVEVIRADVGDIKQESGEMVLWIQGKGRDSKDELVLLTEETLNPIREYLEARGKVKDSDPLFISWSNRNRNERLTTRTIRGIVKKHLKQIGINSDRITTHSLRHTFGVMGIKSGASFYDIQLAMRHIDPATTQIYLKSIEREKRIQNAPERKITAYLRDNGVN